MHCQFKAAISSEQEQQQRGGGGSDQKSPFQKVNVSQLRILNSSGHSSPVTMTPKLKKIPKSKISFLQSPSSSFYAQSPLDMNHMRVISNERLKINQLCGTQTISQVPDGKEKRTYNYSSLEPSFHKSNVCNLFSKLQRNSIPSTPKQITFTDKREKKESPHQYRPSLQTIIKHQSVPPVKNLVQELPFQKLSNRKTLKVVRKNTNHSSTFNQDKSQGNKSFDWTERIFVFREQPICRTKNATMMALTPQLQNSSFFSRDDLEKHPKQQEYQGFFSFPPHKVNPDAFTKSGEVKMREEQESNELKGIKAEIAIGKKPQNCFSLLENQGKKVTRQQCFNIKERTSIIKSNGRFNNHSVRPNLKINLTFDKQYQQGEQISPRIERNVHCITYDNSLNLSSYTRSNSPLSSNSTSIVDCVINQKQPSSSTIISQEQFIEGLSNNKKIITNINSIENYSKKRRTLVSHYKNKQEILKSLINNNNTPIINQEEDQPCTESGTSQDQVITLTQSNVSSPLLFESSKAETFINHHQNELEQIDVEELYVADDVLDEEDLLVNGEQCGGKDYSIEQQTLPSNYSRELLRSTNVVKKMPKTYHFGGRNSFQKSIQQIPTIIQEEEEEENDILSLNSQRSLSKEQESLSSNSQDLCESKYFYPLYRSYKSPVFGTQNSKKIIFTNK